MFKVYRLCLHQDVLTELYSILDYLFKFFSVKLNHSCVSLWLCYRVTPWHCSSVPLWLWYRVSLRLCTAFLCDFVIMLLCDLQHSSETLLQCFYVTLLQCYYATLLQCSSATLLQCYYATMLLWTPSFSIGSPVT